VFRGVGGFFGDPKLLYLARWMVWHGRHGMAWLAVCMAIMNIILIPAQTRLSFLSFFLPFFLLSLFSSIITITIKHQRQPSTPNHQTSTPSNTLPLLIYNHNHYHHHHHHHHHDDRTRIPRRAIPPPPLGRPPGPRDDPAARPRLRRNLHDTGDVNERASNRRRGMCCEWMEELY